MCNAIRILSLPPDIDDFQYLLSSICQVALDYQFYRL